MNEHAASALLSSTQNLRTHWSGVITTHLVYSFAINAALWAGLAASYTGVVEGTAASKEAEISLVAGLSALLLGLWRWYARYIDVAIANLYPDFVVAEASLGIPPSHGTTGYLGRTLPRLQGILHDGRRSPHEKAAVVRSLVDRRRAGDRGHRTLDYFALALILFMGALVLIVAPRLGAEVLLLGTAGIGLGVVIIGRNLVVFHRMPTDSDITAVTKIGDGSNQTAAVDSPAKDEFESALEIQTPSSSP